MGRIDVLVNSGGHGPRGPVLEITDEQWHLGLDIYLMNVIRPVRIVAPIMQAQKSGSIINFSSVAAFEPVAGFPTSAVFRAGLAAYAKVFADTYAADNVRMNNIQCGWIDSLPTVIERCDGVPMKRYGSTAEIAATVAFLASEGGVTSPDRTCGSMAAWDAPYSVEPEGLCGAQPQAGNRSMRNREMSCSVSPLIARSAAISPTTPANLPCPEHGETISRCDRPPVTCR